MYNQNVLAADFLVDYYSLVDISCGFFWEYYFRADFLVEVDAVCLQETCSQVVKLPNY